MIGRQLYFLIIYAVRRSALQVARRSDAPLSVESSASPSRHPHPRLALGIFLGILTHSGRIQTQACPIGQTAHASCSCPSRAHRRLFRLLLCNWQAGAQAKRLSILSGHATVLIMLLLFLKFIKCHFYCIIYISFGFLRNGLLILRSGSHTGEEQFV